MTTDLRHDRFGLVRMTAIAAAALALAMTSAGCFDLGPVDGLTKWKTTNNVTDWRDEVIYQLMVDRYANGDPNNDTYLNPAALGKYQGGDWQGVIDHMDYLQKLGVTTIWLSPVVRNVDTDAGFDGYHGYWTQSFVHTNPHFGDLAKLRQLVDEAHKHRIKVVLDIVTNHVGQLFYYDMNNNGQPDERDYLDRNGKYFDYDEYDPVFSPNGPVEAFTDAGSSGFADIRWIYMPEIHRMPPEPPEFQNTAWYHRRGRTLNYDDKDQLLNGDFPGGLKDVATERQDVRDAMVKVFNRWIDAADFDGFRIDTLKHVEEGFWEDFCPKVRAHCKQIGKQNFFMFGESFDGNDEMVGKFTRGTKMVDSAFYFPQKYRVYDRVFRDGGPTTLVEEQLSERDKRYGKEPKEGGPVGEDGTPLTAQQLMVNFIDNHDTPRWIWQGNRAPDDALEDLIPALHNVLGYMYMEDGIPCLFYGTEQQFTGGNDPANRPRLWDTGYRTDGETFRWIRKLADLRRKFSPLRRGETKIRWTSPRTGGEKDAGILAFERVQGDMRVLVVVNAHKGHASSTEAPDGSKMPVGFAPGTTLVNVLGEPETVTVGGDGKVGIQVPKRERLGDGTIEPGIRVYVAQGDEGGLDPI